LVKTPTDTQPNTRIHMAPWLDDYASGKLESACAQEFEAHLLVCDCCFAALVALIVRRR